MATTRTPNSSTQGKSGSYLDAVLQQGRQQQQEQQQRHHPHNASSRSKQFARPLPSSLMIDDDSERIKNIERIELNVSNSRAFVLKDILSKEECQHFIDATNEIGYHHSDVKAEYPKEYRNNERLIILDDDLAYALWRRVLPHLKHKDIENATPLGWATEGTWLPVTLNECFLFSKYSKGSFFKPHYDGMYKNDHGECSIFTITFYLNSDYEGGRLMFLDDKEVKPDDITERVKGTFDSKKRLEVLHTYEPRQGSALLFNHDSFHEGEEIVSGVKYIMRSSIMFRKVQDLTDPKRTFEQDPMWQLSKEIFASFPELLAKGNTHEFTMKFLEAQALQLKHGRCLHGPPVMPETLPLDVLYYIFGFLDKPQHFTALMKTCKGWNNTLRYGYVWKELYQRSYGKEACSMIKIEPLSGHRTDPRGLPQDVDDGLIDWYGIYRNRYTLENKLSPIISYVASLAHAQFNGRTQTTYATVYEDTAPWDNSYPVLETCAHGWPYFDKETLANGDEMMNINFRLLAEVWRDQFKLVEGSGVNHSIVLIVYPMLWDTRIKWQYQKNCLSSESTNNITYAPRKLQASHSNVMEAIKMLSRTFQIQSLSMIDAEASALYYCDKSTTGITVFEFVDSDGDIGTVWQVISYRNLKMVSNVIFAEKPNQDPTQRVVSEVIKMADSNFKNHKSVVVALSSNHSFEPRISHSYRANMEAIELAARIKKHQSIQERLTQHNSLIVKTVTPLEVLEGAKMYLIMNGPYSKLVWASALHRQTYPNVSYSNCLKLQNVAT